MVQQQYHLLSKKAMKSYHVLPHPRIKFILAQKMWWHIMLIPKCIKYSNAFGEWPHAKFFWWLPECIWGLPKCLSWGLFLDSFHRQLVTSVVCWYITLFGFINFFTFSPAMLFNSLLVLVSLLLLKLDYHFEWPEPINPIKISTIEPCDQYISAPKPAPLQ